MEYKRRARIIGTGSYTPPRRLTNDDFARIVETSDDWIVTRTGIKERRICDTDTSDMATAAAQRALDMAGCVPEDIELLVIGTVTPDYRLPSTACVVQQKLGCVNAFAFDVVSACTGFLNGLSLGRSFIESGQYATALVIGAEKLSSITNYQDRGTCVLFGDAAGATVLRAESNGHGVLSTFMKSDPSMIPLLWIPTGGTHTPYTADFSYDGSDKIYMNGAEVFKVAVKEMGRAAQKAIADAGIEPEQLSLLVPHQANIRIIEAVAKRVGLCMDKVFLNIEKYGNTSSASIPLALDEAVRSGAVREGDHVLMVAFGAGLTWGSALVKW